MFDEYDPPRMAVAEAWVPAHRRVRFASPEGLGQAFNFDLLQTDWDAAAFRKVIDENLALAREAGASSTWVLSNHDMVRHATRYAVPNGTDLVAWLRDGATDPAPDVAQGLRRARAATLLALALPGSAYLYQGEELGLPEVTDLPPEVLQDPTYARSGGSEKGRDGCRVPAPVARVGGVVRLRVRARPTSPSRRGSAGMPWSASSPTPTRPCSSTSRPSPTGARCSARRS